LSTIVLKTEYTVKGKLAQRLIDSTCSKGSGMAGLDVGSKAF